MKLYLLNDVQLLEGLVGSLIMPLLIIFFRYTEKIHFLYSSILAFFLTWIVRKITVNNYVSYKKSRGDKIYNYELTL